MLDFSQTKKKVYPLVKEGTYETELKLEWSKTGNGDPFINCIFFIRTDVNQEHQGERVFDGIYKNKATGEFNYNKIKGIIETTVKKRYQFEDYDELIQELSGTLLRINVEIEKADESVPGSKDRNIVSYCSYQPTRFPVKGASAPTVEEAKKQISENVQKETSNDVSDDEEGLPW